ncbi:hypothetical protein SBC1_75350 (plasmid) [Caballeronia sp. SBC1]|nr:hypothetical protein SBC2_82080 [Caballeronia sp. SBC2]QIN67488.1 hypothetical protein SBC1_75350 [Caballeronia sp. SBC1]
MNSPEGIPLFGHPGGHCALQPVDSPTCGEALVKLLERYGVERVFGIPGVHAVELYRGLARSTPRRVTPRHQ